jgi:hypothetical protein
MGPTSAEIFAQVSELKKVLGDGGHIKSRRAGFTSFDNVFKGSVAVTALKGILRTDSDSEALSRGQLFIENGFFHRVELPDILENSADSYYQFFTRPSDQELLDLCSDDWVSRLLKLVDVEEKDPEWTSVKNYGEETKAFVRNMPPSKLKAVKITTKTKATSTQLRDLLHINMIERCKEWSKSFNYGSILQYVNSTVCVQYWLFVQSPLDPREFVILRRLVEFDDGGVAICEMSIDHGLAYPPHAKKSIRCDMPFQVRYWKPLKKDDPNSGCFLLQANQTDIKGWIPNSVANSANIDVSYEEIVEIQAAAEATLDSTPDGEKILQKNELIGNPTLTVTSTASPPTTTQISSGTPST